MFFLDILLTGMVDGRQVSHNVNTPVTAFHHILEHYDDIHFIVHKVINCGRFTCEVMAYRDAKLLVLEMYELLDVKPFEVALLYGLRACDDLIAYHAKQGNEVHARVFSQLSRELNAYYTHMTNKRYIARAR